MIGSRNLSRAQLTDCARETDVTEPRGRPFTALGTLDRDNIILNCPERDEPTCPNAPPCARHISYNTIGSAVDCMT